MITTARQVAEMHITRSGVLPYTIMDGEIYFLFGVDSKYNQLTDFGGGVKKTETLVTGGYREFQEESHSIFSKYIKPQSILDCVTLLDDQMAIIFLPIRNSWYYKAAQAFSKKKHKLSENASVVWVNVRLLMEHYVKQPIVWEKVSTFLKENFTDDARENLVKVYNQLITVN